VIIIAQPKSGSSALVETLFDITGFPKYKGYPSSGWDESRRVLPVFANPNKGLDATGNINLGELSEIAEGPYCQKLHLFPSRRHYNFFKETKAVILLRDPKETMDSYKRFCNYDNKPVSSTSDWVKMGYNDVFYNYIRLFNSIWENLKGDNIVQINYKDLALDPTTQVNRVLAHYNIAEKDTVELKKVRFSGKGPYTR